MPKTILVYFSGNTHLFSTITNHFYYKQLCSENYDFCHFQYRIKNEEKALNSIPIIERYIAKLKELSEVYKNIVLVGFSLGACKILSILYKLCEDNTDRAFMKKLKIITVNSDIFYPPNNYDKFREWKNSKIKYNWQNKCAFLEWMQNSSIPWYHIYTPYNAFNYPDILPIYNFIKFFRVETANYYFDFLNHDVLFLRNKKVFKHIKRLLHYELTMY